MDITPQDALLLDRVIDPSSKEYKELLGKLLKPPADGMTHAQRLNKQPEFKYTLPYRGEPDIETLVTSKVPIQFSERAAYANGIYSLALTAVEMLDLLAQASSRRKMTATLAVSASAQSLYDTLYAAGSLSSLIYFCERVNLVEQYRSMTDKLETMIVDHTTINLPIDKLLNFAYRAGVRVVDGVFPYHVAGVRGWDVVTQVGKWSYTHSGKYVSVGPDDDSTRLLKYLRTDYKKFIDPSIWEGNSRQYMYEIRKCENGLAVYRAVYIGDAVSDNNEKLSFKLPMCSSDEMMIVSINRQLAAGAFVSRSNNARELAELEKDYIIEVRKDLFMSCVSYLISMKRNSDVVGDAIRYVYQHNYVDLMDGVRVVRCQSLSYADGLCVAMVCALTAFQLRYRLTNESIPTIRRATQVPQYMQSMPLGALGRLAWLFSTYVVDSVTDVVARVKTRAMEILFNSDFIPGVCYDLYLDTWYQPEGQWFEPTNLELVSKDLQFEALMDNDPFVGFHGDNVATYAPTALAIKEKSTTSAALDQPKYIHNVIKDPASVLQNAYDEAFPGNSVVQLQNVAELRRVRDVNINTEFYGKIEVNKDIAAPEQLHQDMPIRTAALPVSRTPLLDAIMASAKRNFNPPDLQMQSSVYTFSQFLVDEFIENCFVPGYRKTLQKAYEKDPITLNVTDYMAWLSGKNGAYRSALEAECPNEMVELELEKYDTIIKRRVKPKLSVASQHELAQPQVVVSMSKKDTAPFTSVFRQIFERLDSALRPEIKSAGRLSDAQITEWLTDNMPALASLQAIEMDSGKYDKSQNLLARLIEAHMMEALGLDPNVNDIFADSYVGRVSSKTLGLVFISAYQMKSGAPDTMLGNLIYNCVSAGRSVGYDKIAYMIAKGDDNVLWLKGDCNGNLAVSKMSNIFNLETKLITNSVICFSSGYFVFVDGIYGYFAPDPLKIIELLGEGNVDTNTMREQFVSFGDRTSAFTAHVALPERLQSLVRLRHANPHIPVVDAIDAILTVASDSYLFYGIKRVAVSHHLMASVGEPWFPKLD